MHGVPYKATLTVWERDERLIHIVGVWPRMAHTHPVYASSHCAIGELS